MKPHIPGRWHAHGLDHPRFTTGAEVVGHLGAVQSQLHDMALWAIGRRCGRTLTQLQAEFDEGQFVRTHVLRPTWHDVMPDDLHWLQSLSAERVRRLAAPQLRQLGLTDDLLARTREAAPSVLADGPLSRTELEHALTGAGADVTGPQMAYVAMHLEISCVIASGPMRGKQHTYQLLHPRPPERLRDDLLTEIAQRYAQGHGAFRDRDLAWWASLSLTDARRAIDLAGLRLTTIDDESYAVPDDLVDVDPARATLLPNYDEYISYARDSQDVANTADSLEDILRGTGLLLVDGRLAGRWTRSVRARTVDVTVVCRAAMTGSLRRAIEDEAEAFGTFLGREARLLVSH